MLCKLIRITVFMFLLSFGIMWGHHSNPIQVDLRFTTKMILFELLLTLVGSISFLRLSLILYYRSVFDYDQIDVQVYNLIKHRIVSTGVVNTGLNHMYKIYTDGLNHVYKVSTNLALNLEKHVSTAVELPVRWVESLIDESINPQIEAPTPQSRSIVNLREYIKSNGDQECATTLQRIESTFRPIDVINEVTVLIREDVVQIVSNSRVDIQLVRRICEAITILNGLTGN